MKNYADFKNEYAQLFLQLLAKSEYSYGRRVYTGSTEITELVNKLIKLDELHPEWTLKAKDELSN